MRGGWSKIARCSAAGIALAAAAKARAASPWDGPSRFANPAPLSLMQQEPESVYAPPAPSSEETGYNEGAVHVDLTVRYLTDYVYRGVDQSEYIAHLTGEPASGGDHGQLPMDPNAKTGHEDSPNLQVDSKLAFDLGKLPHPFVGVFVNVFDSDPISRFQEVRPIFGVDWTIRPFIIEAGHQTYIFPERENANTGEIYGRITLDDRNFFRSDRPVLSPYIYAAYDY